MRGFSPFSDRIGPFLSDFEEVHAEGVLPRRESASPFSDGAGWILSDFEERGDKVGEKGSLEGTSHNVNQWFDVLLPADPLIVLLWWLESYIWSVFESKETRLIYGV